MDPHEALADLTQISVQITNALLQGSDGAVLGSTLADHAASERLARLAGELWEAADRTRSQLGRDELAPLEVATPEGSVFLVHDGVRSIVATTSSDPTVGLVFYDLKACLRSVAESDREAPVESEPPAAEAAVPPAAAPEAPPAPAAPPAPEPERPARPFSSSSRVFGSQPADEEGLSAAAAEEQRRMLDGESEPSPDEEDVEDDGEA